MSISNIISKIEDDSSQPKYLITEYGMGYKIMI
jgi:DNA-binding response OmpR family regulator